MYHISYAETMFQGEVGSDTKGCRHVVQPRTGSYGVSKSMLNQVLRPSVSCVKELYPSLPSERVWVLYLFHESDRPFVQMKVVIVKVKE